MKQNRQDLTEGNIKKQLIALTGPMIIGILGLSFFNVVDTFFVSMLGTLQLAAISFTFPVILVMNSLILGVSTGVTAAVSKVVGMKDKDVLHSLVQNSLMLAIIVAVLLMLVGFLSVDGVLRSMGAAADTFKYARLYLMIWFFGLPFVVLPMVGNGIIRALGDTKTPAKIMIFASLANLVLDPLFIFGIWIFPEWGIAGAAFATVIGRFCSFVLALYVLIRREKVLKIRKPEIKKTIVHFKQILSVAAPESLSRVIIPLGSGIITAMLATFGPGTVAGYGIAAKLEMFLLVIASAVASVSIPFVGQNIGAGKIDRVKKMLGYVEKYAFVIQLTIAAVVFFTSPYLAMVYTKDPDVINVAVFYLRIVSFAYAFKFIIMSNCAFLNVMRKPFEATFINLIQMYALFIPLAYLLKSFLSYSGIFAALAISLVFTAMLSTWRTRRRIKILEEKNPAM